MRTLATLFTAAALLMGPVDALAARPHAPNHTQARAHHAPQAHPGYGRVAPAGIVVTNHANELVDVHIGGRNGIHVGSLRPGATRTFSAAPGRQQVTVTSSQDGWVLAESDLRLRSSQRAQLDVHATLGTVVLRNDGDRTLRLAFSSGQIQAPADMWLQPGETRRVQLRPGALNVTSLIETGRRSQVVDTDQVYVANGSRTVHSVGWYAPPPRAPVHLSFNVPLPHPRVVIQHRAPSRGHVTVRTSRSGRPVRR